MKKAIFEDGTEIWISNDEKEIWFRKEGQTYSISKSGKKQFQKANKYAGEVIDFEEATQ